MEEDGTFSRRCCWTPFFLARLQEVDFLPNGRPWVLEALLRIVGESCDPFLSLVVFPSLVVALVFLCAWMIKVET